MTISNTYMYIIPNTVSTTVSEVCSLHLAKTPRNWVANFQGYVPFVGLLLRCPVR